MQYNDSLNVAVWSRVRSWNRTIPVLYQLSLKIRRTKKDVRRYPCPACSSYPATKCMEIGSHTLGSISFSQDLNVSVSIYSHIQGRVTGTIFVSSCVHVVAIGWGVTTGIYSHVAFTSCLLASFLSNLCVLLFKQTSLLNKVHRVEYFSAFTKNARIDFQLP